MRVGIYGAGAMGTVLGAFLAKSGLCVDLISRNQEHIAALRENGARIVGSASFTQKVNALTPNEMTGQYNLFFLMTKQRENASIVRFLTNYLSNDGVICTMQNGLPEPSVAEIIGVEKTYGCAVAWGATMERAGVVRLTSDLSALTFALGSLGNASAKLNDIAFYLSKMGKVEIVPDLLGSRWAKLSVNAAFSGLSTISGMTFGEISKDKLGKEAALRIFQECALVAEKANIRPAKIQGHNALFWLGGRSFAKKIISKILLSVAMKKHSALLSGMLIDLKKGKKCEIDYIDGVISSYGQKYGVKTPFCDTVCRFAHEIEDGKREISQDNLYALLKDVSV